MVVEVGGSMGFGWVVTDGLGGSTFIGLGSDDRSSVGDSTTGCLRAS